MLTYSLVASSGLLLNDSLIFGVLWKRPDQNPEETKQTHGDFPDFIIGKTLTEFLFINGLELVNGVAA